MIKINHIERTPLKKEGLSLMIESIFKSKNSILISFDNRISDLGSYHFDAINKVHIILISPIINWISPDLEIYSEQYAKRKFVSTLLHELRHAFQRETMGMSKFRSEKFSIDPTKKTIEDKIYFSPCEKDARDFEKKNIQRALKIYHKHLRKAKK